MGKIRSSYPSMDGSSISMNAVIVGYYLPEVVAWLYHPVVVVVGCSLVARISFFGGKSTYHTREDKTDDGQNSLRKCCNFE